VTELALALVDLAGLAAAIVLGLLAWHHLRLVAAAGQFPRGLPNAVVEAGAEPEMLVQIPVFDEPRSVAGALATAAALDWPRDRLLIQLLDDSDDETSAIAAREIQRLRDTGTRIEHVRRGVRTGFKAGALAHGLSRSRAPFVAMMDADFRPDPAWLRIGVRRLLEEPRAAFAQFRFEYANGDASWMTRAQRLLVDGHFVSEQAGRLARGGPIQFNGTAGIWRRAAIDRAGGWTSDTLAEDLDLTIRAFATGWSACLVLDAPLAAEAPETAGVWRVQQRRWSRGFVQVAAKALPIVWRSGLPLARKWSATLLLGLQLALPASLVLGASILSDAALRGGFGPGHAAVALGALLAGPSIAVAITWPAHRRLHRGSLLRYVATVASLPPLFLYLAAANSLAIVAAPFAGEEPFVRTPKSGQGER
jgi:hypothetical protein